MGVIAKSWTLALLWVGGCSWFNGDPKPLTLVSGERVQVAQAVKGDELVVRRDGAQARVRLLGIHAFQAVVDDALVKNLGEEGRQALAAGVDGREVRVTLTDVPQDDRGRYLGYVDLEGADVAADMVRQGWVAVYTEFPFARERHYLKLESEARTAKKGLWEQPQMWPLVAGLRRQWREFRTAKGAAPEIDPLLDPRDPTLPTAPTAGVPKE